MSRRFCKVMLGRGSSAAAEARTSGFIGADYDVDQDLSSQLPDDWREFNSLAGSVGVENSKSQPADCDAISGDVKVENLQ